TPSLPASDGFQNPVRSSGLNSKICNPTNQLLDRSVSAPASICSSQSSLAEPTHPRADESLESPSECQINPRQEHPLLLQPLPRNASSASNNPSPQSGEATCHSQACLSQKTLKEALIAETLKESNAKGQDCGKEHPLEVTEENSLADGATKHRQNEDKHLSSEEEQIHELPLHHQLCREPEKDHLEKQTETTDPEPPCCVGGVEKLVVEEANQEANHPKETKRDGLEKASLSWARGSVQTSTSCSCVHMEASMEVDVAEQAVAEVCSSVSEQEQAESRSVSGLNLDTFSMESGSSLSDPLPPADVPWSKSTSEVPEKCNELSNLVAEDSSCPSSNHQLDTDPGQPSEEPCFSLTSALKELHKLLIINQKREGKILAQEEVAQLEVVHKEPATQRKGLAEDVQKGSDPASQEQCCSSFEVSSEGGRSEGKQLCGADPENISTDTIRHTLSALHADDPERQKFSGKSDLVLMNSTATSDQQQSSEQAEGYQSPTSEQTTSTSSAPALDEGAPPDTQSPFVGALVSSSSAPESPWPLGECGEPLLSPPAGSTAGTSAASPPPAFPAADIDRILGAGFSTQEALEALERANGNADLALLILLAKGIVVPT
ncbi:RSCA1 protein, partial [Turnix velox]|nr:RSCA1 protein [Turnix velox]